MINIVIQLDSKEALTLLNNLVSGKQVESARRRSLKKTATWAKGQIASLMAQDTQIPRRAFADFRIKTKALPDGYVVWFGTLPIAAAYVGNLRQAATGAFARDYFWEGAFVATMKSGHRSIFKRAGDERKPIYEQAVALVTSSKVIRQVSEGTGAILTTKMAQELRYELFRQGRSDESV